MYIVIGDFSMFSKRPFAHEKQLKTRQNQLKVSAVFLFVKNVVFMKKWNKNGVFAKKVFVE